MSVIKDAIRNIRKSLVLDFVLLVQFASCFFASTYLISYYFNIEETKEVFERKMGKNLYWIFLEEPVLEGNKSKISEAKECINDLRASDNFEYMVISYAGAVRADAETCRMYMEDSDRQNFQEESVETDCYNDRENGVKWTPELKSVTLDWKGYQYLNRSLKKGREFKEEDFIRSKPGEEVPIMLGNDYAEYFEVGDSIKLMWSDEVTECRIIGFLEKNSNANLSSQQYLDSYIIYPSQDRTYGFTKDVSLAEELYHYTKCLYAWVITESDVTQNQVTQELNGIMSRYPSLGNLGGEPQTFGTKAFQGELQETVDMIAGLVGIWLLFLIFTVFMILFNKIDMREREYAILLMNGIPYGDIVKSYLLELGIFLFGAVLTTCIWQPILRENIGKMNFARYYIGILTGVAIVILIIAAIVLRIHFNRMDIEQLMKKKE